MRHGSRRRSAEPWPLSAGPQKRIPITPIKTGGPKTKAGAERRGASTVGATRVQAAALDAHPAWMEFNLEALVWNYRELRRRLGPNVAIIASMKANAYGHGVVSIAQALSRLGVYAFATGSFDDALALRQAGINAPIQLFAGGMPAAAPAWLAHGLIPTIHNHETARAVCRAARKATPVYIKVDSGLGRLGIPLAEAASFITALSRRPNIVVEGVYTHLSFSDDHGLAWTKDHLRNFENLLAELAVRGIRPKITQALASGGASLGVTSLCNAVCVGHHLYGLPVTVADNSLSFPYKPVLSGIRSRIIHVSAQDAGERIGTGGNYTLPRDAVLAVIPLGRVDGQARPREGSTSFVLVRGKRAAILFTSLEYTVIDVTDVRGVTLGDIVTLLGRDGAEHVSVQEAARRHGVSTLDFVMAYDRRLPAHYLQPAKFAEGKSSRSAKEPDKFTDIQIKQQRKAMT